MCLEGGRYDDDDRVVGGVLAVKGVGCVESVGGVGHSYSVMSLVIDPAAILNYIIW